ncbi:MAG TPA: cyclic nucleotide-binding domain-containing protein [Acetobacteraceae bacterium]|nr:cyclic nucleotide-binding domain-containing protein [Acetobacteraceae bacterium]
MAAVSSSPSAMSELLRLTPLFESLDDRLVESVADITRELRLPEDTEICRQGEPAQFLYVLLEGRVALWASAPDDSRAAVEVIRPPGYFVLATVLSGLHHLMTAQTVSPSYLLAIDSKGMYALVQHEVDLANACLRAEALNFRALVRQVQDLKLRTAAQRLGCYLLALCSVPDAATDKFRLPFDKRLLAARLGCRQENLSRAFAALRSVGVETHGARVILHDIPALRHFAVPDECVDPGLSFSG